MINSIQYGPIQGFRLARTLFGKGWYYTGCYFIDGLLIDSGCAHTSQELNLALSKSNVHTIVNTHHHEDHIGGNFIFEKKGTQILASKLACSIINEVVPRPPLKPYQYIIWGYPKKSNAIELNNKITTERHCFQVIETPGHCPDHICLYEPNKGWIFSGDAYIGGKEKNLRCNINIWKIIASLKYLIKLNISLIFTGNGSLIKKPYQILTEKINYLESKGQMVLEYYSRGYSISEIRKILFGHKQLIYYITMGEFSGENLVRSFLKKQN